MAAWPDVYSARGLIIKCDEVSFYFFFFPFLSPSSLPSLVTITQVPAIVNLMFYDSFITKASRSW